MITIKKAISVFVVLSVAFLLFFTNFIDLRLSQPPLQESNFGKKVSVKDASVEMVPGYFLHEMSAEDGTRTVVQFIEDTDENRKVFRGELPGREGPVSISVSVIGGALDGQSLSDWVSSSADSNFNLSPDKKIYNVIYGGKSGLAYFFDGLYRAEVVALPYHDAVYMFTVTYLDRRDKIVSDFYNMLNSLAFYTPSL